MIVRRLPMLVLTIAVVVVVVLTMRVAVAPDVPVFSTVSAPWMPSAPVPGGHTSSWFCPGVPANGAEGTGGRVTVFNSGDSALHGQLTVLRVEGEPVTQSIEVPPLSSVPFDLDALVDSPFASALVEIDGGGGLVEQVAINPAGESVSACANASNDEWYLAAGDTLGNSAEQLVVSNPHDYPAVVNVVLGTESGHREPPGLASFAVPARSVRVVDINDVIGDQSRIGVRLLASRGRVIVGRSQLLDTDARRGYVMSLAAPALRDQWWFVYGQRADDVVENYYLYNPSDEDAEVTPVPLGFQQTDEYLAPDSFVVESHDVVEWQAGEIAGLPDGAHSIVFSTPPDTPVVVERVVTRTIQGVGTTSITVGASPRPDGYVASTWYVGLGPSVATADALAVYNITSADAEITVEAVSGGGVAPVAGLESVTVRSNAVATLDLPEAAIGNELILSSTAQIFVERILPREPDAQGRVAVWAVPANT